MSVVVVVGMRVVTDTLKTYTRDLWWRNLFLPLDANYTVLPKTNLFFLIQMNLRRWNRYPEVIFEIAVKIIGIVQIFLKKKNPKKQKQKL